MPLHRLSIHQAQSCAWYTAVTEAPTGAYMAEILQELWHKWNIQQNQVHIVLRDGARAMEKLVHEAGVMDELCLAHVLQLVVRAPMESQRMVKDMLTRTRAVGTHFNHSGVASRKLAEDQLAHGEEQLVPIQDVPTRWNSTYIMIERMLKIKDSIVRYSSNSAAIKNSITGNDWILMEKLKGILEPFYDVTKEICKEDAPMSVSIPLAVGIKTIIEAGHYPGIGTIKDELLVELHRRIGGDLETKNHLIIATYLDPRQFLCIKQSFHNRARELIRELITANEEPIPETTPPPAASPAKRAKTSGASIWDRLAAVVQDEPQPITPSPSTPDPLSMEFQLFENHKTLSANDSGTEVLQWWAERQQRNELPILRDIARRYLAAPPSTVNSERVFSKIGLIYGDKRKRLGAGKADMLLFLNTNLPKCNYAYEY